MSPTIREGKGITLSRQVSLNLRQKIHAKEYLQGAPLPSLRTLKDEYGVTLGVVQRALRELETEGVVQAHHGKGVMVVDADPAHRTAINFGFIYPYSRMAFSQDVLYYAERVFRNRHNLLVAVSSEDNSRREKETARHLVHNGVKGLIVWPCEESKNGAFFNDLASKIPIVVVDRFLEGAQLPAVVFDTYQVGIDVATYFFQELKRKRLLIVMDNLRITPYSEFLRGVAYGAKQLQREDDFDVLTLPLSDIIQSLPLRNLDEISPLGKAAKKVRDMLRKGSYDALFSYQNDFIDYGLIDSGILNEFPALSLGTTGGETNVLRRRYYETPGAMWLFDHSRVISTAADKVQQWLLSRQPCTDVLSLSAKCIKLQPDEEAGT